MAGGRSALERAVLHRLAAASGHALDSLYSGAVHQLGAGGFFERGFGDLSVVHIHRDSELLAAWPPTHFEERAAALDWRRARSGAVAGAAYDVFEASFDSPVAGRARDALPPESRTAHALWVRPRAPAPGAPTALHLAATGDHGFGRREHLGLPLVARGVGTLALESPFYGRRRPAGQRGARLARVSDLLLLGRATLEEALLLLHWLRRDGAERIGVAGLSMGGVHACMVASLYPGPLALAPLLAPRSAAAAYVHGALARATAWERLQRDSAAREAEILAAVEAAAAAGTRVAPARAVAAAAEREAAALAAASPPPPPLPLRGAPGNASEAGRWEAAGAWLAAWSGAAAAGLAAAAGRSGSARAGPERHAGAAALLERVLEAYTDVTRFPVPARPDAAVVVGATHDLYVGRRAVLELHAHLPGSEVRWVPGGHVSSFILHQQAFRDAIADSLDRL
jgi:hypothetical protein